MGIPTSVTLLLEEAAKGSSKKVLTNKVINKKLATKKFLKHHEHQIASYLTKLQLGFSLKSGHHMLRKPMGTH